MIPTWTFQSKNVVCGSGQGTCCGGPTSSLSAGGRSSRKEPAPTADQAVDLCRPPYSHLFCLRDTPVLLAMSSISRDSTTSYGLACQACAVAKIKCVLLQPNAGESLGCERYVNAESRPCCLDHGQPSCHMQVAYILINTKHAYLLVATAWERPAALPKVKDVSKGQTLALAIHE